MRHDVDTNTRPRVRRKRDDRGTIESENMRAISGSWVHASQTHFVRSSNAGPVRCEQEFCLQGRFVGRCSELELSFILISKWPLNGRYEFRDINLFRILLLIGNWKRIIGEDGKVIPKKQTPFWYNVNDTFENY